MLTSAPPKDETTHALAQHLSPIQKYDIMYQIERIATICESLEQGINEKAVGEVRKGLEKYQKLDHELNELLSLESELTDVETEFTTLTKDTQILSQRVQEQSKILANRQVLLQQKQIEREEIVNELTLVNEVLEGKRKGSMSEKKGIDDMKSVWFSRGFTVIVSSIVGYFFATMLLFAAHRELSWLQNEGKIDTAIF